MNCCGIKLNSLLLVCGKCHLFMLNLFLRLSFYQQSGGLEVALISHLLISYVVYKQGVWLEIKRINENEIRLI